MTEVRGVAFDLDGTLVDTTDAHDEAYRRAFASVGVEIGRGAFGRYVGRHHSEIIRLLVGDQKLPIEADELHRRKTNEYQEIAPSIARPLPLLEVARLLMHTRPLALVTSATLATARASLETHFAMSNFACVIAADHVEAHKPSPEPYLAAARRLGIDAADLLVFEDSAPGIESACAAGCRVVGVMPAAGLAEVSQ